MKNYTADTEQLFPGAPSMAAEISSWQRRSARRAGRRSAKMTVPDAEGHHPATRAMAAQTAQVEAHIHTALVKVVESLDRKIAPTEAKIRLLTAELLPEAPEDSVPEHPTPTASLTAAQQDIVRIHEEAIKQRTAQQEAIRRQLAQLQEQVADLSQRREHLHTTAIGVLASWISRFDGLVSHHQDGFVQGLTRRFPAPRLTVKDPGGFPVPRYRPVHVWAAGEQLPVTITEVHPRQQPTLRWAHLPWNV